MFLSQSFVDSVAFWCHPSTCCEDKGIEWRLFYVYHSLVVLILFFMLLVDLWKGLTRIRQWGWMCGPYVKECFLTAIPQSSRRNTNLALSAILTFLSKSISLIGRSVGSIWKSLQTFFIICSSESLTELSHWSITASGGIQTFWEQVISLQESLTIGSIIIAVSKGVAKWYSLAREIIDFSYFPNFKKSPDNV